MIDQQKHQLTVSLPAEPLWLDADPVRMAQVVANLLNNAAKYNDKPGHIVVSAAREGDEAVLRVLDDGMGIDPELLPRVFDLFTQADRSVARSQGGLGIGLTLVRSLVERHGGRVQVESEGPGKGSEFIVRLPALREQPADHTLQKQPDGQPGFPAAMVQRRVLVVDDNADAARAFAEIAASVETRRPRCPRRHRRTGVGQELSSRRGAFGHRPAGHERLPGSQAVAAAAGIRPHHAGGRHRLWPGGRPPPLA